MTVIGGIANGVADVRPDSLLLPRKLIYWFCLLAVTAQCRSSLGLPRQFEGRRLDRGHAQILMRLLLCAGMPQLGKDIRVGHRNVESALPILGLVRRGHPMSAPKHFIHRMVLLEDDLAALWALEHAVVMITELDFDRLP